MKSFYKVRGVSSLLSLYLIFTLASSLNFPLVRGRQTCFVISQGHYQFQYIISGHNEHKVRCIVQQADQEEPILLVQDQSQYEGKFSISQNEASICFSSMDTLAKSVSMDFVSTDDPLHGLISSQDKLKTHESLFSAYQSLQRVYRDQHFFIQRNFIHEILLRQTEMSLLFFMMLKLVVVVGCGCVQMWVVKRILEDNFVAVPAEEGQESSGK